MTVHPHEPVRTRRSALASRLGMVCLAGIAAALAIVGASAAFGGNGGTSRAAAATAALTAENFPGGRNIQGDKILMSLASTPSNSFYIPQVAGAKAAAKITGLNVQFQYGKDDDPTQVSQVNTALAS